MEWENFRQSSNIEDRRGDSSGGGGGGIGIPIGGGGGLGIGAIIVIALISWALGIDPRAILSGNESVDNSGYSQPAPPPSPRQSASSSNTGAPSDQMGRFVSAILAENEDTWSQVLPDQKGIQFRPATLVLYTGGTRSGCGIAQSAMGPFYCSQDQKIYLDTAFFREMQQRLGGGGDFAYAYVISHEMGHHIQDLLGVLGKVQQAQRNAQSQEQANAYSVRLELMADCLAGVWAANADQKWHILQQGDVEKAINTAQAIGDDQLQRSAGRNVMPDSFTHGSSAQRVQWLQTGLRSGRVDSCNTFSR